MDDSGTIEQRVAALERAIAEIQKRLDARPPAGAEHPKHSGDRDKRLATMMLILRELDKPGLNRLQRTKLRERFYEVTTLSDEEWRSLEESAGPDALP